MNANLKKILIIDDEPLILASFSALLSGIYDVLTAEEGISGLTTFCEEHHSLVVLDVNLPFMNGVEVLSRIRKIDRETPVIMMTGRDSPRYTELDPTWIRTCIELGISRYLVKPVDPKSLIGEIERMLKQEERSISDAV